MLVVSSVLLAMHGVGAPAVMAVGDAGRSASHAEVAVVLRTGEVKQANPNSSKP
jgi:hypothetical protein